MRYNNRKTGQALFFVLFILAIFAALSGALTIMWESEIRTRSSERDGLLAFYIAQAGIERAKIELAYDENWAGIGPVAYNGGSYTVSAQNIFCPAGPYNTCKRINSTGNLTASQREITVDVSLDSPPPSPPNTVGDEALIPWSWREI